jgi:hypothetical protein
MQQAVISLYPNEVQSLLRLMDLAAKAGGLAVTDELYSLKSKISRAIEATQKDVAEKKSEPKEV